MNVRKGFTALVIAGAFVWIIIYKVLLRSSRPNKVNLPFKFRNLTTLQCQRRRPIHGQEPYQKTLQRHGNIHWVVGNGTTLVERVSEFQNELSKIREQFVCNVTKWTHDEKWGLYEVGRRVWAADRDTLYELQNEDGVVSVALTWIDSNNATTDPRNLLLKDYYRWVDDKRLCEWKRTTFGHHVKLNESCTANQTVSSYPEQIDSRFLNQVEREKLTSLTNSSIAQYTEFQAVAPPPHIFYVHLIGYGTVDKHGNVLMRDIKIFPIGCGRDKLMASSDETSKKRIPFYNEVFVATQFWGSAIYHNLLECLPRLSPYVHFLKSHPDIKIHIPKSGRFTVAALDLLGIRKQSRRLVGGTLRAAVVYLPQGTACGKPGVHNIQLLSQMYRDLLKQKFPPSSLSLQRNSIVVIKRTRTRFFKEASEIESLVQDLAEKSGFRYEVFADNPVPSLEDTMKMFNRARIVVAPHGAGLSNLLFSEPGTVVIEVLCNPPRLCFQATAYILGHEHRGLFSDGSCDSFIDIPPTTIGDVLAFYIKQKS